MVTIRLARRGAKKKPFYFVVATDSRKRRDSGYKEKLGTYNPVAKEGEDDLSLNLERVDYWLSVGAQVSDSAKSLITRYRKAQP